MGVVCSRFSGQRIQEHALMPDDSNSGSNNNSNNKTSSSHHLQLPPPPASPQQPPRTRTLSIPESPSSTYNLVHRTAAQQLQDHYSNNTASTDTNTATIMIRGLRNLGNTCFMNSSLQCLSATIPLTDYFLGYTTPPPANKKKKKENPLGTGGHLTARYAALVKDMWLGNATAVTPSAFKTQLEQFAPQFRGHRQHDAHELLALLLDGIHEDLNRVPYPKPIVPDRDCDGTNDANDAIQAWEDYLQRDKSPIVDIFQGQLRSTLTCGECGNRSVRFEPFMYLSLPITEDCTTLQDCLQVYLQKEELTGHNQWYCGKCKAHCDATKQTDLWVLPPILICHLKRFSCNAYGHVLSKNHRPIDFPLEQWNLQPYVKMTTTAAKAKSKSKNNNNKTSKQQQQTQNQQYYDLYAVSHHLGNVCGGGHYTATTKSRWDDDTWFDCNDQHVKRSRGPPTTDPSASKSAYVLFYNRTTGPQGQAQQQHQLPRLIVRRQSSRRPDLWPHHHQQPPQQPSLRDFARPPSSRTIIADASLSSM